MTTRNAEVTIPEHTEIQTVYIACDGQEFLNKYECMDHELEVRSAQVQKYPTLKVREEVHFWPEEYFAAIYFLESDEAYEVFKYLHSSHRTDWKYDDYVKHGPGYYFLVTDSCDNSDMRYLYHVEAYDRSIMEEYESWSNEVSHAILKLSKKFQELKDGSKANLL